MYVKSLTKRNSLLNGNIDDDNFQEIHRMCKYKFE